MAIGHLSSPSPTHQITKDLQCPEFGCWGWIFLMNRMSTVANIQKAKPFFRQIPATCLVEKMAHLFRKYNAYIFIKDMIDQNQAKIYSVLSLTFCEKSKILFAGNPKYFLREIQNTFLREIQNTFCGKSKKNAVNHKYFAESGF